MKTERHKMTRMSLAMLVLGTALAGIGCQTGEPLSQTAPTSGGADGGSKLAAPIEPVYAVPLLDGIVIDGSADDWGKRGFKVDALVDFENASVRPAADHDLRFRLGWSEQGLLVCAEVSDDVPVEADADGEIWSKDAIELFMAAKYGEPGILQVMVAPGMDANHPQLRHVILNRRNRELLKNPVSVQLARKATSHGYVLEALLPWSNLGLTPTIGGEVPFQISLTDADGSVVTTKTMWYPVGDAAWNSKAMYRLQLAKEPSPAVRVAATGGYERFRRTRIGVVAAGDLAGRTAVVTDGERRIGSGVLVADGRRASVEVVCPMPEPDKAYGPLTVSVDDETAAMAVTLPDPRPARREAFESAPLRLTPSSVFSGTDFPTCEYEQPSLIEDLVGEYRLHTDFYAADFSPVKTADKPGRYGAVVTVTAAGGVTHKRYVTLFRRPAPLDLDTPPEGPMPEAIVSTLRIDPEVVEEQSSVVLGGLLSSFSLAAKIDTSHSSPAVLMAALYETKLGTEPVMRNSHWARNGNWWFELKRRTGDFKPYLHKVRLPKGYDADPAVRHPLIIVLGTRLSTPGDTTFGKTDIDTFADAHPDFPFIVVTPKEWWHSGLTPKDLGALLDDLLVRYRIDPDRVYATGASVGGNQTWGWALDQPERFAAIAPLCSFMDTDDAARLKDLPIWIFHGEDDRAVPVSVSYNIKTALEEVGGKPKLTVYPGVEHNSWTKTYANPELYAWLLQQRRNQRVK